MKVVQILDAHNRSSGYTCNPERGNGHAISPLLAQTRHVRVQCKCLLWGAKRTSSAPAELALRPPGHLPVNRKKSQMWAFRMSPAVGLAAAASNGGDGIALQNA